MLGPVNRKSGRARGMILIVATAFVAVMFIAGHCECDGIGNCIYVDDGGTIACVNFGSPGSDQNCFGHGSGGGGGGGGGGSPTAVPTATATPIPASIWETLGGSYANDTPCSGLTGDPIGTVFLLAGANAATASQLAFDRLSDIAMTSGYNVFWTTQDKFRDNGGCVTGEITRATNDGWHFCLNIDCTDSRWHTRCIVHAQPSQLGYWASCTPHWDWPADQPTPPAPPSCIGTTGNVKHVVPPVYNGAENYSGSGYDAARDWLWWSLIKELGMTDAGHVFFDNKEFRSQCNNVSSRAETGKVNVIALPCCSLHLDMDPATPGVQSSLTVSGPQDISVDIVLGDTVKSLGSFNFSLIYDDTRLHPAGLNQGGLDGNPDFSDGLGLYWNCGQPPSPSPDSDPVPGPGHGLAYLSCIATLGGYDLEPATKIATLRLHVTASGTSTITIGDAHFAHWDATDIGTCGAGGTLLCVGGSVAIP